MSFWGYRRPDGSVGTRNYVLIVPGGFVAEKTKEIVHGVRTVLTSDQGAGRSGRDRATMARCFVGWGLNPNVAAVIVQGASPDASYPELSPRRLAEQIAASGKRVELLTADACGGTLGLLARTIEVARELTWEASRLRREEVPDSALTLGVKCGSSDPTSGIAGNPVVGYVYDKLVGTGGTALFGENTEIVGAEHILAKRATTPAVAEEIFAVARRMEERSRLIGEDLRTVNPVPANIRAGITTLEEKSLGAIHKSGHAPIQAVLEYGERPPGPGLYFVDDSAQAQVIHAGQSASGAQLLLYQLGGKEIPENGLLHSPIAPVSPLLWLTANPDTTRKARSSIDFSSAPVVLGEESIEQAGERLYQLILDTASGSLTKVEPINHVDPLQMYLTEPLF